MKKAGNQKGAALIGVIVALAVVYLLLLMVSSRGYGYAGYGGYHRGPSFFYWGGVRTYHGPSVRAGSIGGPRTAGGGTGAGK